MEFAIAGIMSMKHYTTTEASDQFSNFIGFVSMLIAFTILPAVFICVYSVPVAKFRFKSYRRSYGVIFLDIKTSSRWHASYIGILTLRRLAFLCIVFGLKSLAGPQI